MKLFFQETRLNEEHLVDLLSQNSESSTQRPAKLWAVTKAELERNCLTLIGGYLSRAQVLHLSQAGGALYQLYFIWDRLSLYVSFSFLYLQAQGIIVGEGTEGCRPIHYSIAAPYEVLFSTSSMFMGLTARDKVGNYVQNRPPPSSSHLVCALAQLLPRKCAGHMLGCSPARAPGAWGTLQA